MKNLENYGVQELNAREIQETDGGSLLRALRNLILALAAAHEGCGGHSGSYINQGGVTVASYEVH